MTRHRIAIAALESLDAARGGGLLAAALAAGQPCGDGWLQFTEEAWQALVAEHGPLAPGEPDPWF